MQLNCIEPEKKVGAEAAFRALQFQISVRGGEHANINLARLRRANALHLAGLQHAQQFGLLLHRNVGDFIEKQRAVIGEFKTSNAVGAGVSESAFDMAEQLALERAFRKTTGIYSDHRTARARREHMQGLSDNFFSRAMLARDQYVRVARANAAQQHQQRLHGLGFRNEHRPVLRAQKTILGFQTLGPPHSAVKINLRADNAEQALIVPRLLNEVAGAAAHGFNGQFHAAPRGHHDDGQLAVNTLNLQQQVNSLLPRCRVPMVVQVHQHQIELARLQRFNHSKRIADSLSRIAFRFQQQAQSFADIGLIIGDKDPDRLRFRRRWSHALFRFGQHRLPGTQAVALPFCVVESSTIQPSFS